MRNTGNNSWGYNMSKDIEFSSSDIKSEYSKPEKIDLNGYNPEEIGGKSWQRDSSRNKAIEEYEAYHEHVLKQIEDDDGCVEHCQHVAELKDEHQQEMDKLRERLLREVNSAYEKGFNDNIGAN